MLGKPGRPRNLPGFGDLAPGPGKPSIKSSFDQSSIVVKAGMVRARAVRVVKQLSFYAGNSQVFDFNAWRDETHRIGGEC